MDDALPALDDDAELAEPDELDDSRRRPDDGGDEPPDGGDSSDG